MANITRTYFLTLFDEFSSVPSAKVDAFIGVASVRVAAAVWGDVAEYATALLTAHMLSSTGGVGGNGGSAGGPVTAESVGDLSRSYGSVGEQGSGDQELLTTRYGQEYVALRRQTIVPATILGR